MRLSQPALVVIALLMMSASGCITHPSNPAATQPATAVNPATTQPSYWLSQPSAEITSASFDSLWNAAEDTARDYGFVLDRTDYREGVMTTRPRVSPQFFEIWRRDIGTSDDTAESSVATIRRTVYFNFAKRDDGTFEVSPRILVERYSAAERRITSVVQYKSSLSSPTAVGNRERDAGLSLPAHYWYPIGRDDVLEERLAVEIEKRLKSPGN